MAITKRYLSSLIVLVGLLFVGIVALNTLRSRQRLYSEVSTPTLKGLADKKGIQLGNFAIPSRLGEEEYRSILTTHFHFVLADNQPNWHFTDVTLRPSPTAYDFRKVDEVVGFAEQNNMPVQAHHYVWGEEKWLPDWLKNGQFTKDQLHELIRSHILTVGGKYKGRISEWTVVNEAFTRGRNVNGLSDWWGKATGSNEYIDLAFIAAREADPDAVLILNDFGNEEKNDVSDEMYEYIKAAKARGVPIDGIGMQMHIDGAHPPSKQEVIDNMKRFGELGVDVYITEFDANMNDVQADPAAREQIQGQIYYEMMRACIESKVCKSFAVLGITDKETWYNYMDIEAAKPLLFDENYQPKQSFYSLREALEQP